MYLHANKIKSDYSLKSYNQIIINTSILKFNRDCPPHANGLRLNQAKKF